MRKAAKKPAPSTAPAALAYLAPLAGGPTLLGGLLLAVAAVAVYYPALPGGFIVDDNVLLTDNPLIRASDGLWRIWFTTQAPDYWPLSHTSFWLEWRLWGLWPTGYRCTNVLLHIGEALLLWQILARLAVPGAFVAALLFTVHPVNVETVAWIAQRKTLLSLLFCQLSLLSYQHVHNPGQSTRLSSNTWLLLSLLAFALAMLSKASVATYPLLLLCILWWQRPLQRRDFAHLTLFLSVSAFFVLVNLWFRSATHGLGNPGRSATGLERLLGAGAVPWFYLSKAFFPIDLILLYPEWEIDPTTWSWWLPLVASLALTLALALWPGKWSRPLLLIWACFCLALLPVMGFTDVGYMQPLVVADHYQHLALPFLLALLAAAWRTWQQGGSRLAAVVLMAVLASWSGIAWRHSRQFIDGKTLYEATLASNPRSWLAHTNLGSVLFGMGRWEESIAHYREAMRLRPDFAGSHFNLAVVLRRSGQAEEALAHFRQAIERKPDYHEAQYAVAVALAEGGRNNEAITAFERYLVMAPGNAEAHYNLATTLLATGRPGEAIPHLEETLRLQPNFAEAAFNLAGILMANGRLEEALPHYERALASRPDLPGAHANLGHLLVQLDRINQAIQHLQLAQQQSPGDADLHNSLGVALSRAGRRSDAARHFERAIELQPNHPQAKQNLHELTATPSDQ